MNAVILIGIDPEAVREDTWGHLRARPDVWHPGVIVFAESLRVDWDPVYGDDQVLAERWTVDGRTVVHEEGRLAWQQEGGA